MTRTFLAVGPDSTHRVDLYSRGSLVLPALEVDELEELATHVRAALERHPQRGYVRGPDGRLWCPSCADEQGSHVSDCAGAGCPGDNAEALARRTYEDGPEVGSIVLARWIRGVELDDEEAAEGWTADEELMRDRYEVVRDHGNGVLSVRRLDKPEGFDRETRVGPEAVITAGHFRAELDAELSR